MEGSTTIVIIITSLVLYIGSVAGLAVGLLIADKRLTCREDKARPVGSCVILANSIWTIGLVGILGLLVLPAMQSNRITDEFSVFLGYLSIWTMLGMFVVPIVAPNISVIAKFIGPAKKSSRLAWLLAAVVTYLVAWFVVSRNTWVLVGS